MKPSSEVLNPYLFLLVSFIFWVSHFIYVPMLAPYIELKGGSYTYAGLVLGSYGIMQLLCRMPIGIFSDLMKMRRPFILSGMIFSALSCLLFAVTDHLGWILAARSLAGLAASTWVVFTVLYASYFTDQQITKAMGSISLVVVLAQFTGTGVSGYLVDQWGWQAPFWIGAWISIVGLLLAFLIKETKNSRVGEPIRWKDLSAVIREPHLLKVSLLSVVAHGILFTTMFGFTPAYAVNIGFQANEISQIVIAFMVPHAISTILSGKVFVPKLGQWRTLQLAFGTAAVFSVLTPFVKTKLLLWILQGLNGFSLGLLYPVLLAMAIEMIPQEKRATAMGAYQGIYAIGMFTVPFFGGLLNNYLGIGGAFYLSGALGLLAAIFSVVWSVQPSKSKIKKSVST
ncbi:MFS transporter [Siminovitchia sediminis]|uniref:MFS transporter n=1 Tax=Siminovitchia sediminis TaxID=1274353 RepID=A0ABW4KEB3_9BACI